MTPSPVGRDRHPVPWALIALAASLGVVSHGFRPLAAFRTLELEPSAAALGALATAFALGALVCAIPAGWLMDRLGRRGVMLISSVLIPISLGLALFTDSLALLLASAALYGSAQIIMMVAVQSATAGGRDVAGMDSAFGWVMAGVAVGQVLGPLIGLGLPSLLPGQSTMSGLVILFALSFVVSGLAVALAIRDAGREALGDRGGSGWRGLLGARGLFAAFLVSGVVVASLDLLTVFLPLWTAERGLTSGAAAILLAVRGSVTLVSRLSLGRLTRLLPRTKLIIISVSVGAVALAVMPVLEFWGALAAMAAIGFGLGLAQPLSLTWVVASVPTAMRGMALGVRMTSNRIIQAALPAVVGVLAPPFSGFLGQGGTSLVLASSTLVAAAVVTGVATRPPSARTEKGLDPAA